MMDQWVAISTMIVAYLGLTLWVGLRAGRGTSSTVDGFVAGDRNFGFLVMYFLMGGAGFSAKSVPSARRASQLSPCPVKRRCAWAW